MQNVICILGLTIGFSAFILGGYWWYWESHFDNFHSEADRLYTITTRGIAKAADGSAVELDQLHRDDAAFFLQNIPGIENYCNTWWNRLHYEKDDIREDIEGLIVEKEFFNMFYSAFVDGGYENIPFDGSHIILTERMARKYFGRIQCTGEVFSSKKIAGVIKDYPSNTDFRFDFLRLGNNITNSSGRTHFYVLLNRHTDSRTIKEKIEAHKSIANVKWDQDEVKNWSFRLRSLPEVHLHCHQELRSRLRNIQLLATAGLLALISALMNHLVLFIGQQQRKQKKNVTLKSLGASSTYFWGKNLIDLFIPLLMALFLSGIVILLVFPFYQLYTQWQGYGIYENFVQAVNFNSLFSYAIGRLGIIVLLFLFLSSAIVFRLFRKTGFRSPLILRNILIMSQVFIGCFFFFISLSIYKQFAFTQKKDKGLRVENITQVEIAHSVKTDFRSLKEELVKNPYIEDVTYTEMPILYPIGDFYQSYVTSLIFEDHPEKEFTEINALIVDKNFTDFFEMRLREGQTFSQLNDLLINETQLRIFGNRDVLEKPVKISLFDGRVTGVIVDFHYSTMHYPISPLVFHQQRENAFIPYKCIYIKSKPGYRERAREYAQEIINAMNTEKQIDKENFVELSDIMEEFNKPEKTLFRIFGFLSLACILVVTFGVYSLVTLTIEQRKKEISIRKVNGAGISDILMLFLKQYLLLVIIGNITALPLAYYFINCWLENYAYHTIIGWGIFAMVFIATCSIVVLSIFGKIRAAAKENPAESLKTE